MNRSNTLQDSTVYFIEEPIQKNREGIGDVFVDKDSIHNHEERKLNKDPVILHGSDTELEKNIGPLYTTLLNHHDDTHSEYKSGMPLDIITSPRYTK